jgi:hypothetical protein
MFCHRLKLLLPSAVFGGAVKLYDLSEGNDEFIFCLGSHTPAAKFRTKVFDEIIKAKENSASRDESNEGLTTFEALDEATDPVSHPGAYAPSKQSCFFILEGL